tara:strand:+ start:368 stop:469 length:102 start_codon:yes stop_codon:yes gene_type:complete
MVGDRMTAAFLLFVVAPAAGCLLTYFTHPKDLR